ncbi:unnamed protein product (mitochondrion) [Plasmodiophora brassicae]|uniref:Uncharacterized protein n=1 Tax=Plasmodiophora brassicae TaxID=37360 RepID=A0A3P3YM75_PLABS|nr:unnamed protein product [Plasmodiophora brassicae]
MAGARPNPQRLYVPESNHMFHAPEEMPHTDGDDNHPSSPSDDVVSDDVGVLDLTADTWDRDNVVVPESPEIVAQRSQTEGDNGRAQLPSRASIEGTILVHHMLPGWLSDIELLDDNAGAPPYQEYHPARSPGRLPKKRVRANQDAAGKPSKRSGKSWKPWQWNNKKKRQPRSKSTGPQPRRGRRPSSSSSFQARAPVDLAEVERRERLFGVEM